MIHINLVFHHNIHSNPKDNMPLNELLAPANFKRLYPVEEWDMPFRFKYELNEAINIIKSDMLTCEKQNDNKAVIRCREILEKLEKIKSENNTEQDKEITIDIYD